MRRYRTCRRVALLGMLWVALAHAESESDPAGAAAWHWARGILAQATLEEKITLVHGIMALPDDTHTVIPAAALPGAGYVAGVARLGVPALKETDASLGVAYVGGRRHDGATALPSGLATAASWNPETAYANGAVAGQEARRIGFNVLLGGGVNLARDPRSGRNFEYLGEDPLLAGTLAGEAIRGTQAQHVISTIKHYALNDQETGRQVLSAEIGAAAMRESDLLAFEFAIERGRPGAVMCGYNRIDRIYACENDQLLNRILKADWQYPGWVMSDWGAVHGLRAALAGLDQQSGEQLDPEVFFQTPLLAAVRTDPAYAKRLDDMVLRILVAMHSVGLIDHPAAPAPLDLAADAATAERGAAQGIVLLRNEGGLLPLAATVKHIVLIGGHADVGVLSGGGSSQVAPPGGPALLDVVGGSGPLAQERIVMYMPSSPLAAIRGAAPAADVRYIDGHDPAAAAQAARTADVAVVFATQWMTEGFDAPDLRLPNDQDGLIAAVAAANPHTIVVLETGGPVTMPWVARTAAVLELWYPGIRGAQALTAVLFGKAEPSGRLPLTFPRSVSQLPRPKLPGAGLTASQSFDVNYREGSDVGYRWFAKTRATPAFAFGFGLSFTRFALGNLTLDGGATPQASFVVENLGRRGGTEVAQLYLTRAPHRTQRRLLGWARVELAAGERREVRVRIDPRLLADWDPAAHGWRIDAGAYLIAVGESAADPGVTGSLVMTAARLRP
jgi:beta-glucosidase